MTKRPPRLSSDRDPKLESVARSEATIKAAEKLISLAKHSLEQSEALAKAGLSKTNLAKVMGDLPQASQSAVKRIKNLETIAEKKTWLKFLKDSSRVGPSHQTTSKRKRDKIKI